MYLLFAFFLPCAHPILFRMKAHSIVFLLVFFFCTPLICFWSFFQILFKHIINHTKTTPKWSEMSILRKWFIWSNNVAQIKVIHVRYLIRGMHLLPYNIYSNWYTFFTFHETDVVVSPDNTSALSLTCFGKANAYDKVLVNNSWNT